MKQIYLSDVHISGRERELVEEVFRDNDVAPRGKMLERFEYEICNYTGISHAVALSSGTAALHLALIEAGVQNGDYVWNCSKTFIGGVAPIAYVGAIPVFFDISRQDWTLDCDLLEEELESANRHNKLPKVVITTDIYGQSCDLDRVISICDRFDVKVVADSAEALGAFRAKKHAGNGAFATIFSFNGNKIITTSGGGMLLSGDEAVISHARKLSTQARENALHYQHEEIGFNYRMSNVCAAIGIGQLEQLEDKIARRRQIFEEYRHALSVIDGVGFMPEPEICRSTKWLTCMTLDPAKIKTGPIEVLEKCRAEKIELRPLWKPMHLQPVFKEARFVGEGYCVKLFETGLCLPSGSGMSEEDQQRVIETLSGLLE
ncbi:MAG: aminotransferase class I/II-fold pyridoxal phosphate-dependent enzyme [Rhizobiaceae bacterium]